MGKGDLSMNKSLEKFMMKGTAELERAVSVFFETPERHGDFITEIKRIVLQLGLDIISETFEEMDNALRNSAQRRINWTIVKRDKTTLLTTMGTIEYRKTLFINKASNERTYLLDRLLQLEPYARMTEDVEVSILEEASETTYKKAGKSAAITEELVSKETVKNKIHQLEFPDTKIDEDQEKKCVKHLYIDADEGHIPLQYLEKRGDLSCNDRNIAEPKLIYVYEGIDRESQTGSILVNPRYFGGIYEGIEEIDEIWNQVWNYIDRVYEMNKIEQIFLNGDAAGWIKEGVDYLPNTTHVLDEYHLLEYLKASVRYAGENAERYYKELYTAIKRNEKKTMRKYYKELIHMIDDADERADDKRENIEKCKTYMTNNFNAAYMRLSDNENVLGSSTEPHISHLYAQRMSMKPISWSKLGVDKMSRLIIYRKNGGDLYELVRYQKTAVKGNTLKREKVLSQYDVRLMEKELQIKDAKYYNILQSHRLSVHKSRLAWKLF